MSNATWACFDRRRALRSPACRKGAVPCARCGQPCRCLGTKIRVPPRGDIRAWRQLRLEIRERRLADAGRAERRRVHHHPAAGDLAMRTEVRVHEAKDPTRLAYIETHTLDAVARSPKGHWYPTRSRQIASDGRYEMVRHFAVDFDATLPEELFRPLK